MSASALERDLDIDESTLQRGDARGHLNDEVLHVEAASPRTVLVAGLQDECDEVAGHGESGIKVARDLFEEFVPSGLVVGHAATVAEPSDDVEWQVFEHRMRDTYAGYDWGDPVRLWYPPAPTFSDEQVAIAVRALNPGRSAR